MSNLHLGLLSLRAGGLSLPFSHSIATQSPDSLEYSPSPYPFFSPSPPLFRFLFHGTSRTQGRVDLRFLLQAHSLFVLKASFSNSSGSPPPPPPPPNLASSLVSFPKNIPPHNNPRPPRHDSPHDPFPAVVSANICLSFPPSNFPWAPSSLISIMSILFPQVFCGLVGFWSFVFSSFYQTTAVFPCDNALLRPSRKLSLSNPPSPHPPESSQRSSFFLPYNFLIFNPPADLHPPPFPTIHLTLMDGFFPYRRPLGMAGTFWGPFLDISLLPPPK